MAPLQEGSVHLEAVLCEAAWGLLLPVGGNQRQESRILALEAGLAVSSPQTHNKALAELSGKGAQSARLAKGGNLPTLRPRRST